MKSDVIAVDSRGNQTEAVLRETEKVIAYKELKGRDALHLRLLAEEMTGMMRSIAGTMRGEFWIEDDGQAYELHLSVHMDMDSGKREQLLSAASSGRNASAKGLMGRLRDFFDRGADADVAAFTSPLMLNGMYEESTTPILDWDWSLEKYMRTYQANAAPTKEQKEAWDELEKSVVARVADDVKVSIRGRNVEMVLKKKMG